MAARDHDDRHDELDAEHDLYDDSPPRSIFAATWFRAVLILIVLGVIGAVAVPYILDVLNPVAPMTPVIARPASPPPVASTPTSPTPAPPADKPVEARPPAPSAPAMAQEARPAEPRTPPPTTATTDRPTAGSPGSLAKAEPLAPDTAQPATNHATAGGAPATAVPAASQGTWWVQVGAFRNETTAKRLVDKLRADNYDVTELTSAPTGARAATSAEASAAVASSTKDQYDVVVSGTSIEDVNRRLAARGLASRPAGASVVVTPSMPLRDAVKLSQALAVEGLKVQVKRAAGAEPRERAGPAPAATRLYRVRVGGFADRAAAQAAAKELEAKGYKPFVGRG